MTNLLRDWLRLHHFWKLCYGFNLLLFHLHFGLALVGTEALLAVTVMKFL